MSQHTLLVEDLAATVREVPGVALLTPGITRLLRSALSRPRHDDRGTPPAGLQVSRSMPSSAPWRIDIRIVTSAESRAADVARAVSTAVTARMTETHPADTVQVTVTITGTV